MQTDPPEATRTLRVLSYNIRQCKDDRAALVRVLTSSDADVVAVQEPPRGPFGRSRLRSVAQEAGYDVVVHGGAARTTALLARRGATWTGERGVRLPWHPGRTRRGLAVADVALPGRPQVRIVSAHLGLSEEERRRHLIRLVLLVRATPGVGCVVAGDLNEQPGGPTWRRLGLHLHDLTPTTGPTFPARRPRSRLDAVLATNGLRGSGARVLGSSDAVAASDHLPVVVDVSW